MLSVKKLVLREPGSRFSNPFPELGGGAVIVPPTADVGDGGSKDEGDVPGSPSVGDPGLASA